MNKTDLLLLYDKELREEIEYPEARKEVTSNVVRFVRQAPAMNFVSLTYAKDSDLDRVIEQEVAYFSPMNQPFTWKVFDHDPLPSLKAKLKAHQFVEDEDRGDVMVLDLADATELLSAQSSADIRRITDAAGLKEIGRAHV